MSIEIRHTIAYGPRFDVHVRLRGRTVYLGRFATYQAAERCMARFWAEEKLAPGENSKWSVEAREHVSKLRRRKRGELMDEIKKATAAIAMTAHQPVGAVLPRIEPGAAHPLDAINREGDRLKAKLKRLADEFNLAQPRASRIVRHEIGSQYWCRFHGCPGILEVSGRRGVCNVCKRNIDVFETAGLVPRLQLPEVVSIPEGVAEVERLQKAITRVEREIAAWQKNKAAAEMAEAEKHWGNRPASPAPSEYIRTWK